MDTLTFFITCFTSLFAVINPFSAASVFLSITQNNSDRERTMMALKATLVCVGILIVFAVTGMAILNFFNISIDAFRIAGGIVICSVGYAMIKRKRQYFKDQASEQEAIDKEDVSITPLGTPMLAGSGAITTAVVLRGQAEGFSQMSMVLLAILAASLASYIILALAGGIVKHFKHNEMSIIEKVMGLLVLAVGVQFIVTGTTAILSSIL